MVYLWLIQKLTCFSNIYVLINYLTDWYVNLVLPILLQTTVTFRKYLVTPQKRLHYSTRIITLFETHWFILVVFYLHSFALSFIGTAISPFHLLISFLPSLLLTFFAPVSASFALSPFRHSPVWETTCSYSPQRRVARTGPHFLP